MADVQKVSSSPEDEACNLLGDLVGDYDRGTGIGSMSCSIYDTAWVASVTKTVNDCEQYLFPSSFRYLLSSQHESGSWSSNPSQVGARGVDEILSTLAAVFALQRLSERPLQLKHLVRESGIKDRVEKGIRRLDELLQAWDVDQSQEVGFEVLVPSMLDLVGKQGVSLHFPDKEKLFALGHKKLSKIPPQMLYAHPPASLLHSLEAFYGDSEFDYDRVRHHKVVGSMMASPSATAAYLMRVTEWDDDAEAYLRLVVESGAGKGSGGLPSAYPSTHFEVLWITEILMASGLLHDRLDSWQLKASLEIIAEAAREGQGVVGFSPGIEPDLDDTAKASMLLNDLGRPGLADSMTERFATKQRHFATYKAERNPSFSANCNGLLALLSQSTSEASQKHVQGIVAYLCETWWASDGLMKDKWHISPFYSSMLGAQAMMKFLASWDAGHFPNISETFVRNHVALMLFQSLVRTLRAQNDDGSWGAKGPREETSYAILTLEYLRAFPLSSTIDAFQGALDRGRHYLKQTQTQHVREYLWTEKTSYGSVFLSRAYVLGALHTKAPQPTLGSRTHGICEMNHKEISKLSKFMHQLPLLSPHPSWVIIASWIEARLFLTRLESLRSVVFEREGMTNDKYFSWIPFTWTVANNTNGARLSSEFLFDMMTISFLNYQADEYMEAVVGTKANDHLDEVRMAINSTVDSEIQRITREASPSLLVNGVDKAIPSGKTNGMSNGVTNGVPNGAETSDLARITHTLSSYIRYILHYPHIASSSAADRTRLASALRAFLFAHMEQNLDNARFAALHANTPTPVPGQDAAPNSTPAPPAPPSAPLIYTSSSAGSYKSWVRTISAEHTSCPYSWIFACCLRGQAGADFFASASENYIADDVCRHLATMCRMYNDLGSVERDVREGNLNSVNFGELNGAVGAGGGRRDGASGESVEKDQDEGKAMQEAAKARLKGLAEYEQRAMVFCLRELDGLDGPGRGFMKMLRVFVDVTDLFGQIYVVRDIASQRTG